MENPTPDPSETGRLSESLAAILPSLEAFNQFDGSDNAGRDRANWTALLDRSLPQSGAGLDEVLRELSEIVIPNGLRNGAPGFSGWVTTAPTTSAVAATLASTVAGSQRYWIQAFHHLEAVALRWLAELLCLPAEHAGVFVSGGSVANLIGLGAARQFVFEKAGIDPARDGLAGDRRWRIYASSEVHHVVTRAAGVLGLGRSNVCAVKTGTDLRIDVAALREQLLTDRNDGILPVAIVATAGTVNTGVIDPIEAMADLAAEFGVWLHVDGAYGLPGILDPRVVDLFRGVERADSVAVDPHKWLAVPVGCGATFVRNRGLIGRAFTMETAEYLEGSVSDGPVDSPFDDFGETYFHWSVEQSAPSRGVQVWAVLREIGADGMRARVVRDNSFARQLADHVQADNRLELLADPVLSICCFRYRRPGFDEERLATVNGAIMRQLRADGVCVPSATTVNGRYAIRPCFINPRTTARDVEELARRVRRHGDELSTAV